MQKWLVVVPSDVRNKLGIELPPGANPNKLGAYTRAQMHEIIRHMQIAEWQAPVISNIATKIIH